MGTKTIGVKEDVYERLNARKREDESFTELVNRLLDETKGDWRDGFGTLDTDGAVELERIVEQSRERTGDALGNRQQSALEALSEETDETA
jgi:predicted CopG family antitoxin